MTPAIATKDIEKPMTVYDCIVAVSADIARDGIAKTRSNAQQGYKFRGIDEVLNALSPLLAKYRLVILPRILSRAVVERATQKGGILFSVTVEAEFDFVSAADGSTHTVKTYGEAMDSADKATNKAMSAAYKYAAFQTFCIPTEGDNDADAHTPVVRAREIPKAEPVIPTPATGRREGGAAHIVGAPGTVGLPAQSSDDGPNLGAALPPGARLIQRVGPARAGAKGDITFTNGECYLVFKDSVKALAEQFCQDGIPCFPDLKTSQSGNVRVEGLMRVPDDYDPPIGKAPVGPSLTDSEIPF